MGVCVCYAYFAVVLSRYFLQLLSLNDIFRELLFTYYVYAMLQKALYYIIMRIVRSDDRHKIYAVFSFGFLLGHLLIIIIYPVCRDPPFFTIYPVLLMIPRQASGAEHRKRVHLSSDPVTVSDWPSMEHSDFVQLGMRYAMKFRRLHMPFVTDCYADFYREQLIKKGVRFISNYKEIYTTRLHVAILSVLLGKSFHFFDNSYGKNRAFYDTWLNDVDNAVFE